MIDNEKEAAGIAAVMGATMSRFVPWLNHGRAGRTKCHRVRLSEAPPLEGYDTYTSLGSDSKALLPLGEGGAKRRMRAATSTTFVAALTLPIASRWAPSLSQREREIYDSPNA